jgi:hypothetical protein
MKHTKKILIAALAVITTAATPLIAPVFANETSRVTINSPDATDQIHYLPRQSITIETKSGQDYTFDVEMAVNGEDQERGLMFRTQLNNDSGMLFLFDDEDSRTFWMKDTLIPLDMLFIAHDGTINHIHHNAKPQDETRITTDMPAMAVLEINGGLAGTLNIQEGDKVLHPAFRNVTVAPE